MNFCLGLGQNFQQFLIYAIFYYAFTQRSIFNIDDYKIKIWINSEGLERWLGG